MQKKKNFRHLSSQILTINLVVSYLLNTQKTTFCKNNTDCFSQNTNHFSQNTDPLNRTLFIIA